MKFLPRILVVAAVVMLGGVALADEPAELVANVKDPRVVDAALPDLSEYHTVDTATSTRVSRAAPEGVITQPGYLGVHLEATPDGLVVRDVEADSPAARIGVRLIDRVPASSFSLSIEPGASRPFMIEVRMCAWARSAAVGWRAAPLTAVPRPRSRVDPPAA